MSTQVDIRIADPAWRSAGADIHQLCRRAACQAMQEVGASRDVTLLLTDDAEMARLNQLWRGIGKATDVLAFETPDATYAGDVVLGYTTVERDAHAAKRSVADHTAHLVVHGVLHLLGYDHGTDAETMEMHHAETRTLARMGIADPYGTESAR